MRHPVIGITGNFDNGNCCLAEAYYLSVKNAGAVPFIIPPFVSAGDEYIERVLDSIDALLLSGGADVNPLLLGEEPQRGLHGINVRRDDFELRLVRRAFQRQMPILGICRGIQVLAAALGGTVVQDIYSLPQSGCLLKHSQDAERWVATHSVVIEKDCVLHRLFGTERLSVNSFHHQAVGDAGSHLRVVARAADGIVEAVESSCKKSVIGVQWHPESFEAVGDHTMMPLFSWLAGEADEYRRALDVHSRIITLDSHEDTPMFFSQDIDFTKRDPRIKVSLPLMRDGHLDTGIQVAYQAQGLLTPEAHAEATRHAHELLDGIESMVQQVSDEVVVARRGDELAGVPPKGKRMIMMGIENGYAFGTDLSNIESFRRRGVVYCTLCHNGNNAICDSARPKPDDKSWGGLSPFGREVVKEMNRVGMVIDLSHAAESTFYDVLQLSELPVVCSHSNARALCNHPRNLTDDQLRAIAANDGVVQITLYDGFLRQNGGADIDDVMRHFNHIAAIVGLDHIGIGTDFDGDGGVPGLNDAGELVNFTRALLRSGYSEQQIEAIWGGNFRRVLKMNSEHNPQL